MTHYITVWVAIAWQSWKRQNRARTYFPLLQELFDYACQGVCLLHNRVHYLKSGCNLGSSRWQLPSFCCALRLQSLSSQGFQQNMNLGNCMLVPKRGGTLYLYSSISGWTLEIFVYYGLSLGSIHVNMKEEGLEDFITHHVQWCNVANIR